MEQDDQPRRAKSMQQLVLEQLEREKAAAQAQAARNTAGLLGQLSAGDGLYSGGVRVDPSGPLGVQSGQWPHRTYQIDSTVAVDKDATILRLRRENEELRQQISGLDKMLRHPDRETIQSIENLIENVEGQSVFRAGAPFTAKQVFAAILNGGEQPKLVKLIDRDGSEKVAVVTGITIVAGSPDHPSAYYLTNIQMDEMNKKQVITDLVASIIENRVMESIEER